MNNYHIIWHHGIAAFWQSKPVWHKNPPHHFLNIFFATAHIYMHSAIPILPYPNTHTPHHVIFSITSFLFQNKKAPTLETQEQITCVSVGKTLAKHPAANLEFAARYRFLYSLHYPDGTIAVKSFPPLDALSCVFPTINHHTDEKRLPPDELRN